MLQFRLAGPEDIPEVIRIAGEIWPPTYTPIIGAAQVAYMLELIYSTEALATQMADGQVFFLAAENGKNVAYAAVSPDGVGVFKLHKLYIISSQHGRGLAASFLQHIAEYVRTRGAATLQLNVNRYNLRAVAFYEKMGFSRLREEDIDIGGGYWMNDYIYQLTL